MTDYEFDQTLDPSPRSRPMAERDLSPAGRRIVDKLERIILRNARDGRASMDGDFAGIPRADIERYLHLARARANRLVIRQDHVDTTIAEDLAAGDPAATRRALLEAATALEPTDADRVQRLMALAEPGVVAEHWGYVKAGLGQFVAIGKMPEVA